MGETPKSHMNGVRLSQIGGTPQLVNGAGQSYST